MVTLAAAFLFSLPAQADTPADLQKHIIELTESSQRAKKPCDDFAAEFLEVSKEFSGPAASTAEGRAPKDRGSVAKLMDLLARYPGSDPSLTELGQTLEKAIKAQVDFYPAVASPPAYFCVPLHLYQGYRDLFESPRYFPLAPDVKAKAARTFLGQAVGELERSPGLINTRIFIALGQKLLQTDWVPAGRANSSALADLYDEADSLTRSIRERTHAPEYPRGFWKTEDLSASQLKAVRDELVFELPRVRALAERARKIFAGLRVN